MEAFPNARSVTVSGAAHWVHHDRTHEFLAELGNFLSPDGE
jgi:pimeloyl-ACP methyl ester carboxylesterase